MFLLIKETNQCQFNYKSCGMKYHSLELVRFYKNVLSTLIIHHRIRLFGCFFKYIATYVKGNY